MLIPSPWLGLLFTTTVRMSPKCSVRSLIGSISGFGQLFSELFKILFLLHALTTVLCLCSKISDSSCLHNLSRTSPLISRPAIIQRLISRRKPPEFANLEAVTAVFSPLILCQGTSPPTSPRTPRCSTIRWISSKLHSRVVTARFRLGTAPFPSGSGWISARRTLYLLEKRGIINANYEVLKWDEFSWDLWSIPAGALGGDEILDYFLAIISSDKFSFRQVKIEIKLQPAGLPGGLLLRFMFTQWT